MKTPWANLGGPAKVLVIAVAILLVAAGLCGMQALVLSGVRGDSEFLVSVFMITGVLELGVFLVAAVTAAGALLAWVSTVIYNRLTGSRAAKDKTQKLFDDSEKHDGPC